jgi:hypothetical protein
LQEVELPPSVPLYGKGEVAAYPKRKTNITFKCYICLNTFINISQCKHSK